MPIEDEELDNEESKVTTTEHIVEQKRSAEFDWFSLPSDDREEIKTKAAKSIGEQVAPQQIALDYMSSQLTEQEVATLVRNAVHQVALLFALTVVATSVGIFGLWYGITQGLASVTILSLTIFAATLFHLYRWRSVVLDE